jgi:uncharacterized protein
MRVARQSATLVAVGAATSAGYVALGAERIARPLPTFVIGALIGALVTLTSVGAGVLGVMALFFLYPMLPARLVVGTDIAHAVPLTLLAGAGHAAMGNVDWSLLGSLLIGSLPAITLGAALAHRLPEQALRGFLMLMLTGIGARLVFS